MMAGILVYIPQGTADKPQEQLVRVGLGQLLDRSVDPLLTVLRTGPDGGPGVLITFDAIGLPATPREYDAASQTWQAMPPDGDLPGGRAWLGYVKGQKPSAGELQRGSLFDGEDVLLRDGNYWHIPIAGLMPRRLTRDPVTGDEARVPASEHEEFDAWANAMLNLFMSDGFQSMLQKELRAVIPGGMRGAALALAKNYRVTIDVIDLLELVGEIEAVQIAMAASGVTSVKKMLDQKKNAQLPSQFAGVN